MNRLVKASLGLVAIAGLATAGMGIVLAGTGGAAQAYPVENQTQALLANPDTPPPGANVPGCKLDATHPYPVILVNGTTANMAENWGAAAPMLANAGYCVFTFNYGMVSTGPVTLYAMGEIAHSATELQAEVNSVLAQTGASKVDLVGHSQGGMMPRYYIKFLGGASKVHLLIGLSPSNHGTTDNGLLPYLDLVGPSLDTALSDYPALTEQTAGSAFLQNLNAGGDTVPGPQYVVITTTHDEVVTPYTSAFLTGPGVLANQTVQQLCPLDLTGHLSMAYDQPALTDVLNWLGTTEIPGFTPNPISCNPLGFGQPF